MTRKTKILIAADAPHSDTFMQPSLKQMGSIKTKNKH
jgi:hypothetical protein